MNQERSDDRTILSSADPEFISELSEYLDALSSPIRLQILSFIGKKPRTVRQISHEIETSYENTKKHLSKLLPLGLIRKEIGVSDDPANQGQPVFYYSLIPDGLKHAAENLSLFTSVAGNINPDLSRQAMAVQTGFQQIVHISGPGILITNGPRAGEVIRLTGNLYRIGRREEGWNGTTPEPAILLDDEYRSVSRVSKPHAWLKKQAGFWTITDGKSKGGTYVNGKPIGHDPVVLTNGDRVDLSPGPLGVSMIFYADTTSSDTAP